MYMYMLYECLGMYIIDILVCMCMHVCIYECMYLLIKIYIWADIYVGLFFIFKDLELSLHPLQVC